MSTEDRSVRKLKSVSKFHASKEIAQNSLCKYVHRFCFQQRIHGYDFCIRHILEDKNAPFKQCTYVQQPHKKRCTNAAPKTDKNDRREVLCPFHAKQSLLRTKTFISKKKAAIQGTRAFLRSLEHFCKNTRHDPEYSKEIDFAEKHELAPSDTQCPQSLRPPAAEPDASEKSSDNLFGCVENLDDHFEWRLNSKDWLRYSGVLTGKEVLLIARSKAKRLKDLYFHELKRTYFQLKDIRREYLREVKTETRKNSLSYQKTKILKHLESYHSLNGIDKVLRRKSEGEKQMGSTSQQPACIYIQNGKKCTQTAVVCTSYCLNHIMLDPNQCLFVACSYASKKKCDRPVLPISGDFNVCKTHTYTTLLPESKEGQVVLSTDTTAEQEHFQSMDDIASLGLDDITPGSLFGLDQEAECVNTFFRNPSWAKFEPNFGEPGESTDTVMSEEQNDLMQIQPISLNPPADILSDARKFDLEEEK